MRPIVDVTNIVPGRRLIATFQAEEWIHNDAIDCGLPIPVDVTDAYLKLSAAARAAIRDNHETSDDLVLTVGRGAWPGDHDGSGYVEIEDAIAAFHRPLRTLSPAILA
jgi:hypothetical protein